MRQPSSHSTQPNHPAVSVIIPARNAASTLAQTLQSLLAQDWTDWEAVIVDDGSTDDTARLIDRWAHRDPRIRGITGPQRGVSAARNAGVAASRGVLIAFLDADDLWLTGKLAAHVAYLRRQKDVGLSFDRILFIDRAGHSTGVVSTAKVQGLPPHALLYENPACTASTLVLRREAFNAIGGFDETMRFSEDLELMIRLRCTTSWRVEGLPQVLTHYRASPEGASASLAAMQWGWESLMLRVRAYAPEMVKRHQAAARAIHLRYLARRALRLNLPARTGLQLLARAAHSHPLILLREPRRTFGTLFALLTSLLVCARPAPSPR